MIISSEWNVEWMSNLRYQQWPSVISSARHIYFKWGQQVEYLHGVLRRSLYYPATVTTFLRHFTGPRLYHVRGRYNINWIAAATPLSPTISIGFAYYIALSPLPMLLPCSGRFVVKCQQCQMWNRRVSIFINKNGLASYWEASMSYSSGSIFIYWSVGAGIRRHQWVYSLNLFWERCCDFIEISFSLTLVVWDALNCHQPGLQARSMVYLLADSHQTIRHAESVPFQKAAASWAWYYIGYFHFFFLTLLGLMSLVTGLSTTHQMSTTMWAFPNGQGYIGYYLSNDVGPGTMPIKSPINNHWPSIH